LSDDARSLRATGLDDQFLATLSHELRTPLTAIVGWAHLLRRGQLSQDDTTRAIDTIIRNATAQNRIIDGLLDMSRISTGKLQLDLRPVDLATVVKAAIKDIARAAEVKGVRLRVAGSRGGAMVLGDEERLLQVFSCLLTNAVKFTPRDGSVRVSLSSKGEHVLVVVHDSGAGIAAAFLPRIFDRFTQDDSSSTRPAGGLGLGLSIAQKLVELHGGELVAESPGVGQGSSFTTSLPRLKGVPAKVR